MTKDFDKELKKIRKENKEKFDKSKEDAYDIIKTANHSIILNTDERGMICGNKFDVLHCFANILKTLIEDGRMTSEEIIELVNIIDKKSSHDDNLEKLDKLINALEKLNELTNSLLKDED